MICEGEVYGRYYLVCDVCGKEEEYRMQLAREIMRLRDEKMPVSLINDVARGNLAKVKYKRDLAELTYKTSRDMLNALQGQLSGLQTLYRRQDEI